jgi:hypothetical protein
MWSALLGLFGVVAAAMAITSAQALECPQIVAVRITGIDDAADRKVTTDLRAVMNGQLQLAAVIASIRSQAPGASAEAVTNYLIGVYCPLVAGRVDIDETAKTEAVQSFAAQVSKLLY